MNRPRVQLVWFKRDLRVQDHEPIHRAALSADDSCPGRLIRQNLMQARRSSAARRESRSIHARHGSRKRGDRP